MDEDKRAGGIGMRLKHLEEELNQHIRTNLGIYFFIIILFLSGVVLGALAVKTLAVDQKSELINYLQIYVGDISSDELLGKELLIPALWANTKVIILLWLGGLTVVGLPLTLTLIFTKGFSSGFTVAFLVDEIKWRGFLLAATAILPHSLFSIPALLFLSTGAVYFACCVIRQCFLRCRNNYNESLPFWNYTVFMLYAGITMFLATLVETYITPVLVRTSAAWLL